MTSYNYIVVADENNASLINSFEKDLTGDGFQEYVQLHGSLMSDNSVFYQDVWLAVQNQFKNKWSISLQHGYEPEISFIDLTGDKNSDIFYKVAKDEQMENYHYQLYHFKRNDNIQNIELPDHQNIKATFADDFTLKLLVNPTKKPLTLDLSSHKDTYIERGLYTSNGKSNDSHQPRVAHNANISPVLISSSKGYGLKTMHPIYGIDKNDVIANLETIWHYEKDKWINIKTVLHNNNE